MTAWYVRKKIVAKTPVFDPIKKHENIFGGRLDFQNETVTFTSDFKMKGKMEKFKVISKKDQGVYKKGELIRTFTTSNVAEYFGFPKNYNLNISDISSDGNNRVIIEKA